MIFYKKKFIIYYIFKNIFHCKIIYEKYTLFNSLQLGYSNKYVASRKHIFLFII